VSLVQHREYIWRNAVLELRHRFAGSGLGPLWLILYPLALIGLYSAVFSGVMQLRIPELSELPMSFTLYLCAGLIPWLGFSDTVTQLTGTLQTHGRDIVRTALPEQVFVAKAAVAGYLTTLLSSSLVLALALAMGLQASWAWLALPLIVALFITFAAGLGMALGVLNVFSRDVGPMVAIALQLSLWTAPIVYVESILPETLRFWLPFNPLYPFISALHKSILFGELPGAGAWLWMAGVAGAALLLGYAILGAMRSEVRDAL
jgi:lipopolysaccharide transport system permease protein